MDEVDDVGIVDELRSDRTHGFSLLYEAYAERLFAYAITVTKDRELAADVAHNALIRAVDGIEKLRDPALLRPWLFRITRNEAISLLRRGNRWSDDESAIEEIATEPDFDQNLQAADAQALVAAAMSGLSPVDRDVLSLALRKDLSTQDVAQAMGTTTNQASARLSRAKSALTNAVTAVVLCRQRSARCDGLTEAMSDYSGTLSPLTRKRITKHVRNCTTCATTGRRRARQYVAGFTLPIAIATAAGFRGEAQAALVSEIGALGVIDEAGFPVPQDAPGAEALPSLVSEHDLALGNDGAPGEPASDGDFTLDTMFLGAPEQQTEVLGEPPSASNRAGWLIAGAGVLVLLLLVGTGIAIQQTTAGTPSAAVPDAAVELDASTAPAGSSSSPTRDGKRSSGKRDRASTSPSASPTPSDPDPSEDSNQAPRPTYSSSPTPSYSTRPSTSTTPSTSTKPSSTTSASPSRSSGSPSTRTPDPTPSEVSKPTPKPTSPATTAPAPTTTYRPPTYSTAPKPTASTAPRTSNPAPTYSAPAATTPRTTSSGGAGSPAASAS